MNREEEGTRRAEEQKHPIREQAHQRDCGASLHASVGATQPTDKPTLKHRERVSSFVVLLLLAGPTHKTWKRGK